jgi:hypothetical protein
LGGHRTVVELDISQLAAEKVRTVRTNSAGLLISPSQEEGELSLLTKSKEPAAGAPFDAVGWTDSKDNTDVITFVVTVEKVDFSLSWELEGSRTWMLARLDDDAGEELSLDAGAVVCGCGGVKSHG